MRRIAIVGAGQSGLLLGLCLREHGYEVTVVAERDAPAVRSGPLLSSQLVFGSALALERELGVHFWRESVTPVTRISFTAAGAPGATDPAIAWSAGLQKPANGVDQRLRVAAWLEEFARRGGEVRHRRATPEDIDELAREFELVLVAAGRGPRFDALFPRNAEFSPYREPQRFVAAVYLRPVSEKQLGQSLRFAMGPAGEVGIIPALSAQGPVLGMGMFCVPGGPMDVWDDVENTEQHVERARDLLRRHFPWRAGIVENAEPAGPRDSLRGRVTPVVRHPVGTLPSGARVLALGDTAVTNDPLGGQGANLAAHAARSYRDAVLDQGDRPFDEEFMHGAFARYWTLARPATRFSNDLLAPPPAHVVATLKLAQDVPEVARRFAGVFEDPSTYEEWLTDEAATMRYLDEARARALPYSC